MDDNAGVKGKMGALYRKVALLLVLELLICFLTAPLLIFFGPFENIKKVVVGTLYTSLTKRWVVEAFLSETSIDRINGKQGYYKHEEQPEEVVPLDIPEPQNNNIEFIRIDGGNLMLKGYLLIIHDPTTVRVGYSSKLPIEGETTGEIAKANNALAAINAGGFIYDGAWASTGGKVDGYILHEGKVIINNVGDEDTPYDAVGLNQKGQLVFGDYSINRLKKLGVTEAVSFFGPKLIVNGNKMFSAGEDGGLGYNPRTAIGQKATGEILFLVIDGRDIGSFGASMFDLQEILYEHGAVNAINLDGGSSSTLYFNGKLINKPSNTLGERAIPSVFMALPEKEAVSK